MLTSPKTAGGLDGPLAIQRQIEDASARAGARQQCDEHGVDLCQSADLPITQTLSATLQADTIYTLSVFVGNRAGRADNTQFGFSSGLVGSANTSASFLSSSMSAIPNGSFVQFGASCTILAGNCDIGHTVWGPTLGARQRGSGPA